MKNKNKNLKSIITGSLIAIAAVFMLSQVTFVFAAPQPTDTTTNGDAGGFVPCGNTADNPCQVGHLFSAFVVIINYLIAMAGFIAVLVIVYSGFMMVASQGNESSRKDAKGRLVGAIIGLVLVAAAFVIANTLFSPGGLGIGVKNGASILSSPLDYINGK